MPLPFTQRRRIIGEDLVEGKKEEEGGGKKGSSFIPSSSLDPLTRSTYLLVHFPERERKSIIILHFMMMGIKEGQMNQMRMANRTNQPWVGNRNDVRVQTWPYNNNRNNKKHCTMHFIHLYRTACLRYNLINFYAVWYLMKIVSKWWFSWYVVCLCTGTRFARGPTPCKQLQLYWTTTCLFPPVKEKRMEKLLNQLIFWCFLLVVMCDLVLSKNLRRFLTNTDLKHGISLLWPSYLNVLKVQTSTNRMQHILKRSLKLFY